MCPVLLRFIAKQHRYIALDNRAKINELTRLTVCETRTAEASTITKSLPSCESQKTELALLDLYSGCGGMSTGLCLGAKVSSVNLVTVLYMKSLSPMKFSYP